MPRNEPAITVPIRLYLTEGNRARVRWYLDRSIDYFIDNENRLPFVHRELSTGKLYIHLIDAITWCRTQEYISAYVKNPLR